MALLFCTVHVYTDIHYINADIYLLNKPNVRNIPPLNLVISPSLSFPFSPSSPIYPIPFIRQSLCPTLSSSSLTTPIHSPNPSHPHSISPQSLPIIFTLSPSLSSLPSLHPYHLYTSLPHFSPVTSSSPLIPQSLHPSPSYLYPFLPPISFFSFFLSLSIPLLPTHMADACIWENNIQENNTSGQHSS